MTTGELYLGNLLNSLIKYLFQLKVDIDNNITIKWKKEYEYSFNDKNLRDDYLNCIIDMKNDIFDAIDINIKYFEQELKKL